MTRPKLAAQPRETSGKAVKRLRRSGLLPGVVYGRGRESQLIQLDAHEFELLRRETGRHALLDLTLDGGRPQPVLVQAIQEHPVTRHPLHVDLLLVNLREERTLDVPIALVGESVAVDRMGGVLLHLRDSVQVRALPDDIPQAVELDISPLDGFDTVLHASDLRLPPDVALVTDPAEPLARVQPPRVEEEVVPEAIEEVELPEGEEPAEEAAATATEEPEEA